ncbi:MAG: hypothetical protein OEY41_10020 [Acidimicrobiia bacterium]|nr:hypothetical protein [Acidimicrobiia bacterium]MDH5290321.1 hypothetical protein [Acidimicrobiia bacterium]
MPLSAVEPLRVMAARTGVCSGGSEPTPRIRPSRSPSYSVASDRSADRAGLEKKRCTSR